jgi:hypothetical protein
VFHLLAAATDILGNGSWGSWRAARPIQSILAVVRLGRLVEDVLLLASAGIEEPLVGRLLGLLALDPLIGLRLDEGAPAVAFGAGQHGLRALVGLVDDRSFGRWCRRRRL